MREVDIPINKLAGGQEEPPTEPQILLILIGLPGSGKTTFAEALLHNSSTRRQWTRASQDDAPSRRRQECEAVTRNGLRQGHNVIVDRVGFDAVQRSHFINIADQQHPRPLVYALYLSVSIPTLEERLSLRTSHPTLADPKLAMTVLSDMNRQLSIPTPEGGEGFDKIYTLDETLQPANGYWTEKDLERVLGSIRTAGQAETAPRRVVENRPATTNNSRGGGYDPSRGMTMRGRGDHQAYPRGGYSGGYNRGGSGAGYIPRQEDRTWRPYPQPSHPQSTGYRAERPSYQSYPQPGQQHFTGYRTEPSYPQYNNTGDARTRIAMTDRPTSPQSESRPI